MRKVNITVNAKIIGGQVNSASLEKVTDLLENDITDKFIEYCKSKDLPITTALELEQAEVMFSKDNSSWLP